MKKLIEKQTVALSVIIVCFIALSVLLSSFAISKAGQSHTQYGNDFTVFYAAAKNLYSYGDPYNHPIATKTPYLYLPLFALLILPLSLIPLTKAATIWYWLNIIFSLLLMISSAKLVSSKKSEQAPVIVITFLLSTRLIIDNLLWGQVNILVALLINFWLLAQQKSFKWLGELALAIAISIKITPVLLGAYLLIKQRWQELVRLIICFVTLTIVSLVPLGSKAFVLLKAWFTRTILNGEGFNWAYAGNQSLKGAFQRLLSASETESFYYPKVNIFQFGVKETQYIFLCITVLLFSCFLYKLKKTSNNKPSVEVSLIICLMLLLSNLSWKAHFISLVLPLATLSKRALFENKSHISIIVLVIFFFLISLTTQPIIGLQNNQWFETHSYYCLITLIIFLIL